MKFILVAGAAGYLGRHVIAELKRKGHRVRALVRHREQLWKRGETLAPAVGAQVDEIVTADLVYPQSLRGICHQIEAVISCATLSPRETQLNHEQVDYHGNRNLLIEAINAGSVNKFVYVSIFNDPSAQNMDIVKAKAQFVQDLQNSVMTSYVIRPTLFYPEMLPLLYMAQSGRIWLPGGAKLKLNPIHGQDLAEVCVKGLVAKEKEVDVGGPQTMTLESIAQTAFKALNKPPKISAAPGPLDSVVRQSLNLFKRDQVAAYDFLRSDILRSGVAPAHGSHDLQAYFEKYIKSSFYRAENK